MEGPNTTERSSGSSSANPRRAVRRPHQVVLLDTNALFLPIRSGFPLEAEVDRLFPGAHVVIAASGIRELDGLVEKGAPGAPGARALAEKFSWVAAQGLGDDAVVEVALRERAVVLTADRKLQERLARRGLVVLVPRDRHRLEIRPALSGSATPKPRAPRRPKKSPRRPPLRGNGYEARRARSA
jgi:uncharacterized protein